jgi:hypothetical protein
VLKGFGGTALAIALLSALPAHAQRLTAQPVLGELADGPPMGPDDTQASVSREIFRSGSKVGVSASKYAEQDGSIAIRRGLIGSWNVAGSLEAGVGLFSVTGEGRKVNEFKRDWHVKQVTPRNESIAAVGMLVRF